MSEAAPAETLAPSTGAGARLRQAREARQLDVQQVANELRLPVRHIEALETEDAEKLPAPSYSCAYLRKYAALLQLPSDEIVEAFPGMKDYLASVRSTVMHTRMVKEPAEATTEPAAPAPVDRTNILMIGAAVVVALLLLLQFFGGDDDEVPAKVEATTVTPAPVTPPAPVTTPAPATAAVPATAALAEPAATPVEPTVTTESAAAIAITPGTGGAVVTESVATAPTLPPGSELVFGFRGDSWLEVTDATGVRLAFELGKIGQTRTLRGAAPFKILLGVAANVDIRYNGVVYDMTPFRFREMAELHIGRTEDNRVAPN